jgi:hypothetical protein
MKHNFKTLFILITICLPWGIFAQNTQLPDYLAPYITPHKARISLTQERNGIPVLLLDSLFCANLDPETGETVYRFSISYDYNAENEISNTFETQDNQSSGVVSNRSTYFYNTSNGKLARIETETKNGTDWFPRDKQVYAYDSNGYLAEFKIIDNTNSVRFRNTYVNNSSGFELESLNELLFNNELKVNNYTQYLRNADNKATFIQSENYDLATGLISSGYRDSYEYDAAGNIILSIIQNINTSTSQWDNLYKLVSTYTSNNLLATREQSNPSLSNPVEWEPTSRTVQTYINQIEIDSIINYKRSGSGWEPFFIKLHQYASGQLIKDSSYLLSSNEWNITERRFHKPADDIYSIAFGISEGIENQRYDNGSWTTISNNINEYIDLGNDLYQWQFRNLSLNSFNILDTLSYCNGYFHSISSVSTNETLHNTSTTIAPNPYKTGQTIRCIGLENSTDLTFSLYDLAGALISEQNFDGGRGLVLPAKVGAGMYIAVIRQGAQRLKTTKIVVVDAP